MRRDGVLTETDWDTALDLVASRSRELLDDQGATALGFYTSGQLFLEEYYTLAAIGHGAVPRTGGTTDALGPRHAQNGLATDPGHLRTAPHGHSGTVQLSRSP
ncbi:hypothetical protein GCM10007147_17870 [Nocardiopsis kunsanensis]|uniref:Molybdopterin oxidoreductase domain-containing protein n=1 Tax=Nocardiopsis kunsanensis TaxID=141693 RepID=A0A918XBX0_9ACTN|nr:hypothetical protein GCM10007147_17870 [Nocardiopsis kunsanensis]